MTEQDKKHKKTRTIMRIIGLTLLTAGITMMIVSFCIFFKNPGPVTFGLFAGAGVCIVLGAPLTLLSFASSIGKFMAKEQAPVANQMMMGTKDTAKEYVKTVSGGLNEGLNSKPSKGVVCPECHTENEAGAKFCDHCGKPLTRTCPKCGEENDVDANFCRKCGERF